MTSRSVGRESARWRTAASTVALYELVALWTDLPTITRGVHRHPLFGAAILAGLAVHFYAPKLKEIL